MDAIDADAVLIREETELDARLRAIFEESFPPSERETFEELAAGIAEGRMRLFVVRLGDAPVGMGVTIDLPANRAALLSYMAVRPDLRGEGVGGRLLQHIASALNAEGAAHLLLEVESVDYSPPEEVELRRRRVRFYQRHGAQIIPCAPRYRVPNLTEPGVVYYYLMWLPLRRRARMPAGARLRRLVRAIFRRSYGLPPRDPLVRNVIGELIC
jgi:GNAT superfamily N-acetyltransferase